MAALFMCDTGTYCCSRLVFSRYSLHRWCGFPCHVNAGSVSTITSQCGSSSGFCFVSCSHRVLWNSTVVVPRGGVSLVCLPQQSRYSCIVLPSMKSVWCMV